MPGSPADYPTRNVTSRRRYERLPLTACTVHVYRYILFGIKKKAMDHKAVGIDLSEVGMRMALTERLSIGEKVRLVARLDTFKDSVEGEANVVWCVANARVGGEFLAGVEWTALAEGHFAKIQQIRKTMRSKEFQQKLRTQSRMKREKSDGSDQLEYKTPQY